MPYSQTMSELLQAERSHAEAASHPRRFASMSSEG